MQISMNIKTEIDYDTDMDMDMDIVHVHITVHVTIHVCLYVHVNMYISIAFKRITLYIIVPNLDRILVLIPSELCFLRCYAQFCDIKS